MNLVAEGTATARANFLPEPAARRRILLKLLDDLNEFWERLPGEPIGPSADAAGRAEWLNAFRFDQPVELDALVADVLERLERGTLLTQHPGYFGLFNPAPAFPGIIGEFIVAAINPQLAAASHAPLAAEIERHLIANLCARLGWPEGGGHFTTGGAEANMTSALLALTAHEPGFAELGVRAYSGQPTVYASREAHLAWFKIAHQLGIGRTGVRLVETDGTGRMDPGALVGMINADRAEGRTPILVAATAGTTGAGMIDPLAECARVARDQGLWLHVDAAWAGALIASDRLRHALHAIEQADSVTIDAHKWFSVPMGAGMFLTRRPEVLAEAFRVTTSYMPAPTEIDDPYTHSSQWSRRSIGLKFFMTLATLGWEGYAEIIERQVELADCLSKELQSHGWVIENDSPAAVVCFTDEQGADVDQIVQTVQRGQRSWISVAEVEGKRVIRACITNFRTTPADIDGLIEDLRSARAGGHLKPNGIAWS